MADSGLLNANMVGYEKRIVSNVSVALADIPDGATIAVVYVEGADVRWLQRGETEEPTATDGIPLLDGQNATFNCTLADLRFIRQAATDATLHVAYY